MKKIIFQIFQVFFFISSISLSAQSIPADYKLPHFYHSFIHKESDYILNIRNLDSVFQKLFDLKKEKKGVISIVHIGDSHIQPDFMTGLIRTNLQKFFGNAGRGIVFPYQLAQSNAPFDILSSSGTSWQFNRLAHPEIPITVGVSGFCIQSAANDAAFSLSIKQEENNPQLFNHLKFFLDSSSSWILQTNNNEPIQIRNENNDSSFLKEIFLEHNTDGFILTSVPSDNLKSFYGVSLENSNAGILYHTIGVNGARYESFNEAPLFWKQLASLNADLFIVSLGTNEAQKTDFNEISFQQQVNLFLKNLKIASPKAVILITTPADSYYKRRKPNVILKRVCTSLSGFCNHNKIPLWDLYRISSGYGSAYNWLRNGFMNKDRVHFTPEGYQIQGNLLFNAFAKGYNNYISNH